MEFKNSSDIALVVDDIKSASEFFKDVLKYQVEKIDDFYHVLTDDFSLYLTEGSEFKMVMEFYVKDLEKAKSLCLKNGCRILKWNERDHWLIHEQGFAFHLEEKN